MTNELATLAVIIARQEMEIARLRAENARLTAAQSVDDDRSADG